MYRSRPNSLDAAVKITRTYALLMFAIAAAMASAADPVPLPLCPGDEPSDRFTLTVDGAEVPVGRGRFNGRKSFHVAAVEIDRPAEVRIETPGAEGAALRVRPRRHAVTPATRDVGHVFRIEPDWKLAVERADGETLFLFALPPSTPPDPADPDVLHFGPGEHDVGRLSVRSGQTVYLAPGARVRGTLHAFEARDIVVRGRGVWDARGQTNARDRIHGMLFERCQNIRLEGVQVRTGDWWQVMFLLSDDIHVADVQTLSFGRNNDGIDLDGVQRFVAEDCFLGCGDDGFGWHALDAVAFGEPATRDCRAERCVIWNEHAGNGLRIGASMETTLVENLRYTDIDVLHAMNNAIMVDHSDWARVRNVTFERFDNDSTKPLAHVAIAKTRYSNANGYRDARGAFEGLLFSRVRTNRGDITLRAVGSGASIADVCFKDCTVGNRPLSESDLKIGRGVERVSIGRCDGKPRGSQTRPSAPARRFSADTLTLDNGDEGTWAFAGKGLSVADDPSAVGGQRWRLASLGWGHAAVYEPRLRGRFRVEVRLAQPGDDTGPAPWTVKHRDGYATTVLDQAEGPGWVPLGTFALDEESWVRLADPHYQISSGPVSADAVRFVRAASAEDASERASGR